MTPQYDSKLVSELLGLLAHDLRNPLSALHSNIGFLKAMLEDAPEEIREATDDTAISCDSLAHIIDAVEVLAHVLAGKYEFEITNVNLDGVIVEAARRAEPLARSHEVTLRLATEPSANVDVETGGEALARAVAFLIRNSIQHAPAGSQVRLSTGSDERKWWLLVQDDGQTLSAKPEGLAFTAEGQVQSKSMSGARYSRGLGLFCAKICADAVGAELESAGSDGDAGNVFKLSLPLTP